MYFLFCVRCNRLIYVAPSARQCPCTVVFMYKQYLTVNKNCGTCINLRRLISGFIAEQSEYFVCRNISFERQHFRRDLSQLLIPLPVIFVFPILKSGLSNTLNANRKFYPFIVHIFVRSENGQSLSELPTSYINYAIFSEYLNRALRRRGCAGLP